MKKYVLETKSTRKVPFISQKITTEIAVPEKFKICPIPILQDQSTKKVQFNCF